jgi:hypothetical protein
MPYCSSCGSEIPEGQGKSCSMCYGDIGHGSDGYYQEWVKEQEELEDINDDTQSDLYGDR